MVLSAHLKIAIPGTPVPMTLQTMVVSALALTLSLPAGVLALTLYMAGGLAGLPFFTPGVSVFALGLNAILRPTFGYLVGFFPMLVLTWFLGRTLKTAYFKETRVFGLKSLLPLSLLLSVVALVCSVLCFACGALWLRILLGDWNQAFVLGVFPFLLGDVLKSGLVGLVAAPMIFAREGRRNS